MKKYIKSITTALICFAIVIVLNFFLPRLIPGDPIGYLTGLDEGSMSEEKYQFYYDALHLGEKLPVQFWYYLKSLFDGSLGHSYRLGTDVAPQIISCIGYTLQITFPAVLISTIIGLSWGIDSGLKKGSVSDKISTGLNVLVNSMPSFVTGLILIIVLCFNQKIFPYTGLNSIGVLPGSFEYFADRIWHLFLPVMTLVIAETPSRYVLMRNASAKIADEKYILFARQRGLSDKTIKYKYILPNITGPFITMVGLSISSCVGGALVIENLFSINGMGSLLMSAVHSLDYPLMQGILFVTTAIMAAAVIVTDILCIVFDPRIRLSEREALQ